MIQRTLRLQVHTAAYRVGVHVRRRRLDHFDLVDEIRRNRADFEAAIESRAGPTARGTDPIHGHRVEIRSDSANFDVDDLAFLHRPGHTRHALEQITDIFVRDVTEGIRRKYIFHVRGIALLRDGAGVSFAITWYHHGGEPVNE